MNVRVFRQIAVIACLTLLASCGNGGGASPSMTNSNTSTDLPPYINASLVSFLSGSYPGYEPNASVVVQDPSTQADITTAVVTVNDLSLAYNSAAGHEAYEGNIAVAPGSSVVLKVIVGEKTYTVHTTQFTSYPTISIPAAGIWHASIPNIVKWSGGTPNTNAVYNLGILDAHDPYGGLVWPTDTDNYFEQIPVSTTFRSIPANQVTQGDRLLLAGIVNGVPIPAAAHNSQLVIGGFSVIPLTVVDAALMSIAVSPSYPSFPKGTKQQFTVTGTFSDNSTQDLTAQAYWSSIGGISMDYTIPGLAYAGRIGAGTVTALFNGLSVSTEVTVLPPSLLSIQLTPDNRTIARETTQHFTALGLYSDGYGIDITSSAAWSSSDPNVATVSSGQATAVSNGTTTISVALNDITKSAPLIVTDRPSSSGNYVFLQSDTGDYVGQGKSYSFTQVDPLFDVNVVAIDRWLEVHVTGSQGSCAGDFVVPNTLGRLQAGFYDNLTRYTDPAADGLDWNCFGGCNMLTGWFAIDNIEYDSGNLIAIDLRFEQHCEGVSPAIYGWIHWGQ